VSQSPHLVVMAAGMGSRYGGLKQIDPIGPSGEIVLDYAVYDALRAGFSRVVFVVRAEIEALFREKVGRAIEPHLETRYAIQSLDDLPGDFEPPEGRTKPWGTAQAVLCARGQVNAPFGVINADDFYGPSAFRALHDHLVQAADAESIGDYCMIGYRLRNTLSEHGHVSRGVCRIRSDGLLETVVERTHIERSGNRIRYAEADDRWGELADDAVVSMNIWGFTPGFFSRLDEAFRGFLADHAADPAAECYLPAVVDALISRERARVRVLPTEEQWFGVTYKEDRETAREAIRRRIAQGTYPEKLWG